MAGEKTRTFDGYGPVILLIAATYALACVTTERWTVSLLRVVQVTTVGYALRISGAHPRLRVCAVLLIALSLLAGATGLAVRGSELVGFMFLAASSLYLVAPLSIVHDLAVRRTVDTELMMGALATYVMIGMAFGFAYRCLAAFQAGPFYGPGGDGSLADSLFFSFVTLTTIGYGNLVPAGNPGQSLAVLEALAGQLFLVTAVAKIVNAWQPRAWRDRS